MVIPQREKNKNVIRNELSEWSFLYTLLIDLFIPKTKLLKK